MVLGSAVPRICPPTVGVLAVMEAAMAPAPAGMPQPPDLPPWDGNLLVPATRWLRMLPLANRGCVRQKPGWLVMLCRILAE